MDRRKIFRVTQVLKETQLFIQVSIKNTSETEGESIFSDQGNIKRFSTSRTTSKEWAKEMLKGITTEHQSGRLENGSLKIFTL